MRAPGTHTPPKYVNVVLVCHSGPGGHRQTVFDRGAFEVISREVLAKAAALPAGEWHHGIKRGGSGSTFLDGLTRVCLRSSCLRPKKPTVLRAILPPLCFSHTHNKKQTPNKKKLRHLKNKKKD